jgi:hypothetical protein
MIIEAAGLQTARLIAPKAPFSAIIVIAVLDVVGCIPIASVYGFGNNAEI